MIITVTPNTGLDRVIFCEGFDLGKTIRATNIAWGMGGKATDATLVLGELEYPVLALGFAAGDTGHRMVTMLEQHPTIETAFTWVHGETRTNYVIIDIIRRDQSTITASGLTVTADHVDALLQTYRDHLDQATCVVLGGSLPPGAPVDLYATLTAFAKERSLPVILDASGPALASSIGAAPTVVKPNQDELEFLAGRSLPDETDIRTAARDLLKRGIQLVVATIGARGLWAISADEELYVAPLDIEPINTAGAGDGLVAGIAAACSQGMSWRQGLIWGSAAAAAVCLTPGTAVCRKSDVLRLAPLVTIEKR